MSPMLVISIITAAIFAADPPDPRSIPADQRIDYVNKLADRLEGANAARSYRTAEKKYVPIYELSNNALPYTDSAYADVEYNLRDLVFSAEWTPTQRTVIDEWLKRNKGTLTALRRATKKARYFEPLKSPSGRLSEATGHLKSTYFLDLGRLMAARANQAAMDQDWDDAYVWVVRIHHMTDHMYQKPLAIQRIVAAAAERTACQSTIALIQRHPPPNWENLIAEIKQGGTNRCPDSVVEQAESLWTLDNLECWHEWVDHPENHPDLMEMTEMFAHPPEDPDTLREILGDRASKVGTPKYESAEELRSAIRASSLEADWANSRKLDAVYSRWSALPAHIAWEQVEAFEVQYCEAKQTVPSFALVACGSLWSSYPRYILDGAVLLREAMFCQIAIHRFREKEGRWPGALAELVPEFLDAPPIDLFSGKPLIYKVTQPEGTFTLYSVGPNLVDDGGHTGEGFPRPDGDLVFWPIEKRAADDG